MTALSKIQSAGFVLALVNGNLNVTPTKTKLTDTQRTFIKSHKSEIIKQLTSAQIQHDIRDRLEDRPEISTSYCYQLKDKPDAVLTLISRQSVASAKQSLVQKFGDRLIGFYPMPINY